MRVFYIIFLSGTKHQVIIPISKYNIVKEKIKTKVSIILIKNKKNNSTSLRDRVIELVT